MTPTPRPYAALLRLSWEPYEEAPVAVIAIGPDGYLCVGANGETSEADHGAIRIVDGTVMDALYAATRDMGS